MKKAAFKAMLLEYGYTYDKLAKSLNISKTTIVRYAQNDFANMTVGTVSKMMTIFGKERVCEVIF